MYTYERVYDKFVTDRFLLILLGMTIILFADNKIVTDSQFTYVRIWTQYAFP